MKTNEGEEGYLNLLQELLEKGASKVLRSDVAGAESSLVKKSITAREDAKCDAQLQSYE